MSRNEIQIKKLVGRIGSVTTGEYYFCDYIFENSLKYQDVITTVLRPVSANYRNNMTNPNNSDCQDNFRGLWKEAVELDETEDSFVDWLKALLNEQGDEAVFNFGKAGVSIYEYWDDIRMAEPELIEDDYPIFECIGKGRSFLPNMKFDKIYDKKLWERIRKIESIGW